VIHVGGGGQFLLNPALKNPMPGEEIPVANHYKCYNCEGAAPNATVVLKDQFIERTAIVGPPIWLCNPTKKTVVGGPTYDMVDPDQHLVCYQIPGEVTDFSAAVTDQFVPGSQLRLIDYRYLCVPSTKHDPTQTEQSTWGRLKTLYR
jgi:hypothetical protein